MMLANYIELVKLIVCIAVAAWL